VILVSSGMREIYHRVRANFIRCRTFTIFVTLQLAMAAPVVPTSSIIVLGVHRIKAVDAELHKQLRTYYENLGLIEAPAVQAYLARIVPLVLIEVVVWGLDGGFDVAAFRQAAISAPEAAWQVAYEESKLTSDGTAVAAEGLGCFRGHSEGRLAFFLHYYDPDQALQWSYGEVQCPPLSPLPVRLGSIRPYQLPG
jgi:hypothetical protein